MKPSAYVINVARGPIVDETALAQALLSGQIGGAALDVLSIEPAQADCPLLRQEVFETGRCLITPHIAWATSAARQRLLQITVANIEAFQKGTPQNVVR
jgi:glycerate dehydrogenase